MVEVLVGLLFSVGTLVFGLMVILSAAGEALGAAAQRAVSTVASGSASAELPARLC